MSLFDPTDLSRGARVARVTQGAIVYLDTDWTVFWSAFVEALGALLRAPWSSAITVIRQWDGTNWNSWNVERLPKLLTDLQLRGPVPYSKIEFADVPGLPEVGLDWQILPPAQGQFPRLSYLRVRMPFSAPRQDLIDAVSLLSQQLPVQQGRAGFVCHTDETCRRIGFDQAWVWARRYYGIDIVDPVEETWDGVDGLLGVNWLTIVGEKWLKGPLDGAPMVDKSGQLRFTPTPSGGVVIQAGANPILGDHNRMQDVSAYAAVSQLVKPALVKEVTGFAGMFDARKSTLTWIHRFNDPQAWLDAG